METKDILYTFFIAVSCVVSLAALYINYQNRRNAMREHLYKEQLTFFVQLTELINDLRDLQTDICIEKSWGETKSDELDKQINKVFQFATKHEILIPNQKIANLISDVVVNAYDVEALLRTKNGNVETQKLNLFNEAEGKLIDELRDLMGVEVLSQENLSLHSSSFKNVITEKRIEAIARASASIIQNSIIR